MWCYMDIRGHRKNSRFVDVNVADRTRNKIVLTS